MTHIRFIGFGEAARAFTDSLIPHGGLRLSCFDIRQDGTIEAAAAARGVEVSRTADAGLQEVDWVILAVTAASSLQAAQSVLPALAARHVVIDINSVSPSRKRDTAAEVGAAGAGYVDMAVMAPVHPRGHATPVLLAGSLPAGMTDRLRALGFSFSVAGPAPGDATAIKMVRSLFVKGLEALTAQALLAAYRSGCLEPVVASLSGSFAGLGWPEFPEYQLERMLTHGTRRAAEMEESARTIDETGMSGNLAREVALMQARMGALDATPGATLAETLERISARLDS